MIALGCDSEKNKKAAGPTADPTPRASVTLRVAVVSDVGLRRAIDRLRGEWNSRTDGQIETLSVAADADLVAAAREADLIVFPSRAIGVLCEADALRPVRPSILKSEELRFQDFLPLVRDQEIVYAQRVMALPLGSPPPVFLAAADAEPDSLAIPEDDTQLALSYLAWAAPHAVHRSRVATLFNSDNFKPRLTAPPFIRALDSFIEAAGIEAAGEGPTQIAWPERERVPPVGLTPQPIPGADEAYDTFADEWESAAAKDRHATLIASSGRLMGVTKSSRNAAIAFRYAAWLAGPENSRQISSASDQVANCRGSLARAGDAWRESDDRDLNRKFSETAADALRTSRFLVAPRLPGSEAYLESLGQAVRAALEGTPAAEALAAAVSDWETISEARGTKAQKAAYLRSLNSAGPK